MGLRAPVNTGELGGGIIIGPPTLRSSLLGIPRRSNFRSSRREKKQTTPKVCERESGVEDKERNLRIGENAWNGARVTSKLLLLLTSNRTTREKARIQPPSSPSAAMTTSRHLTDRVCVWHAGELEGSGNILFHNSRCLGEENLISAKRCFLAHGTHDLATTQQFRSASGLSCDLSMMWSRISGGKDGFDIAVCFQKNIPSWHTAAASRPYHTWRVATHHNIPKVPTSGAGKLTKKRKSENERTDFLLDGFLCLLAGL